MKLTALPRRNEQEKRVKDISDSFALTRFADFDFEEIKSELHSILDLTNITQTVSSITKDELESVANLIGVDIHDIEMVLNSLTW